MGVKCELDHEAINRITKCVYNAFNVILLSLTGVGEGLPMARLQWQEVYPEPRLNVAECVKKVGHYYLSINAVKQPMQIRDRNEL